VYSVTIIGNVEKRRTEAEISDSEGAILVVVYEISDGCHTDILVGQPNQAATDFQTAVENARESLSHYVNRRGENPPENATWGAFSLWLMVKDDGTAMSTSPKYPPQPGSTKTVMTFGSRSGEFTSVNTGITLNYDNNSVVAKYH
jgi:hypothetical protein